jgi:uncharacterized membrane protein YuzA (DUF378 family)
MAFATLQHSIVRLLNFHNLIMTYAISLYYVELSIAYMLHRNTFEGLYQGRNAMKSLNLITFVLVIVGTLSTSMLGLFDVNLVHSIFGGVDVLAKLVYFLIGVSGIYMLIHSKKLSL